MTTSINLKKCYTIFLGILEAYPRIIHALRLYMRIYSTTQKWLFSMPGFSEIVEYTAADIYNLLCSPYDWGQCKSWTLYYGLDCGLDYGLDSYSFHADLQHPVETPCTIVFSQIPSSWGIRMILSAPPVTDLQFNQKQHYHYFAVATLQGLAKNEMHKKCILCNQLLHVENLLLFTFYW